MSVWSLVGKTHGKADPKARCILWVFWTLSVLPLDLLFLRSCANAQMSSLTAKLLDFTARLSLPLLQPGLICYFKHYSSQYSRQSDSQKAHFNFHLERAEVTFSTELNDYSWHTILSLNYIGCSPATCTQWEYMQKAQEPVVQSSFRKVCEGIWACCASKMHTYQTQDFKVLPRKVHHSYFLFSVAFTLISSM